MPLLTKDGKYEVKTWVISPDCDDNSIILSFYPSEPEWFGFAIIKNKYVKKRLHFEHLLFTKKTCEKIIDAIPKALRTFTWHDYFDCHCFSEILRVKYWMDDHECSFDIFDNYMRKSKRGVEDSITLDNQDLMTLKVYLEEINEILKDEVKNG